jgi:restriction system protein
LHGATELLRTAFVINGFGTLELIASLVARGDYMARRGFFAELQHQAAVAAREAERRQNAAIREHNAAVRRAEQARKAQERAAAAYARASEADRKRFEREAAAAKVAARQAEVEEMNANLVMKYEEIDGLLEATLAVDDYVDLEEFRIEVEHPPFDRSDLETPVPAPPPIPDPPEPVLTAVEEPKGLFGKKKKLAEAQATAQAEYETARENWRRELEELPQKRKAAADRHDRSEAHRVEVLQKERARYDAECAAREAEAAQNNAAVDALIANLGYGDPGAVQEYVSIVLSNSVYPEHFPVEHSATFEPSTAELHLRALVPGPDKVPDVKSYKYTKASDEITPVSLTQKACKDRYASAVNQVALRSLHEVFEADRRGIIRSISLEVGTETIDPATGKETYVPFVAAAVARDTFTDFDLSAVVPSATLERLGAAVSKNPYALTPIAAGGVRRA